MNIALDMMGGDFAPKEAVKGLHAYLKGSNHQAKIFCTGDETILNHLFTEYGIDDNKVKIIHAPQVIDYHEHPTKALKEKPESSIAKGFQLLATGAADAFISAGNTGAMLVGSMFTIKAIEGVQRPTIPTTLPRLSGSTGLLIDVGLNADCKPQHLEQFAVLGTLYAKHILQIKNPKVGLLNIGEEEGKGNILSQAAYPLLRENKHINFYGNVEGRDVIKDNADVIVCDGFTGNVVLKLLESVYDLAVARNLQNDEIFHRFHYENYGGTPVLGVAKPVIIGHGISNHVAFLNMLTLAEKMIETNLCGAIKEAFAEIKEA
jgi:phosphate acyltransferase